MEGAAKRLFAFSCVVLGVVYAGGVTARAHGPAALAAEAAPGTEPVFEPCPVAAPCLIMPLGDSITAGAGSTDEAGYRGPLFGLARADGHEIAFVGSVEHGPLEVSGEAFPRRHEGHGGFTIDPTPTRAGVSPLVERALEVHAPHIVLLMLGTNDITDGTPNAPARFAALLDTIVATRPQALIVVAELMPNASPAKDAATLAFDVALRDVVAARARAGAHVVLVDMYAPFVAHAPRSALFADDVHPNDAGYAVMADTFYAGFEHALR